MKIKLLSVSLSFALALFGLNSLANADEIITLGTKGGPSILNEARLPQSTALIKGNKTYLFDAGYGATLRLVQSKTPLKNIDSIFITHLHSDHVADYPALLLNAWNSGLNHNITVYGPVGTESMTKGVWDTFKRDNDVS